MRSLLLFFGLVSISLWSDAIRIVPAKEFPEPEAVQLFIVFPRQEQLVKRNPVYMQVRLRGFALGTDSVYNRKINIANSPLGQTIRVIVDQEPYFPYNGPSFDPYDEDGNFYETNYKFKLPYSLEEGLHTVRIYVSRSYGEALKGDAVFDAKAFFVGQEGSYPIHLNMPFLTYNEPSNHMALEETKPILLDFFISNCELSKDGYKVKVEIDGTEEEKLTRWRPYYIYGLKKGMHEIRLTLIDSKNRSVFGPFNDIKRTIYVQ